MTQEQKAQAYDKAIERAKELLEIGLKDTRDKKVVLSFFPELKESEDERIRKKLIDLSYKVYANTSYITCVEHDEMLAWLEKQGTSYTKRDVDDAYLEGMAFAKDELEKQKPTWSEEDERLIKTSIDFLADYAAKGYENAVECIDWIKSIKQRIGE